MKVIKPMITITNICSLLGSIVIYLCTPDESTTRIKNMITNIHQPANPQFSDSFKSRSRTTLAINVNRTIIVRALRHPKMLLMLLLLIVISIVTQVMPTMGLEPINLTVTDFKSVVYTIPPSGRLLIYQYIASVIYRRYITPNHNTVTMGLRFFSGSTYIRNL